MKRQEAPAEGAITKSDLPGSDESVNLARLTPLTNDNALLIAIYLIAGVGLPVLFAYLWEFLYHKTTSKIKANFCK